ncbi:MAG: iron ABC transporter substrate-binding protein [Desulfitobacteriia bacterium]|jgi:iron complex transport system substrate-binding protein
MKMKKKTVLALFVIILFIGLCSCGPQPSPEQPAPSHVTDALGREIEIELPAQKIVAIGAGALRLCSYFQESELIVGIEKIDKDNATGKPYLLASPSLREKPEIGPGGPNNAPNPEQIMAVKPDVIFSTYATDSRAADNLQDKTGIPVVVLSYGQTAVFDPQIKNSLKIIGEIIGRESRAQEIIDLLTGYQKDLEQRTKDIADVDKPSVYIGGLGIRGAHGIESTQGNYALFKVLNAKNVVDEIGKTGSLMIDKEKLLEWDPDKIFLDGGGLQMVRDDYKKNPSFYQTLTAVKTGEIYSLLPYNFYATNIDTAIANAYYIGTVLYPEQFADIDPEKKADEIYKSLLGKEVYKQMARDFGGFGKQKLE